MTGFDSIAVDGKTSQITVIGDADPVNLTESLRAFGSAQLVSVGPAKEPEKKPDEKKPDDKKAAHKKPDPNPPITYYILPTGPCDPATTTLITGATRTPTPAPSCEFLARSLNFKSISIVLFSELVLV